MTTLNLGQCPACQQWIDLSHVAPSAQVSCPWCEHSTDVGRLIRPEVRPARPADAPPEELATDVPAEVPAIDAAMPASELADAATAAPVTADGHLAANGDVAGEAPADEAAIARPDEVATGGATAEEGDDAVEVPSPFQIGPVAVRPRPSNANGWRAGIEVAKIVAGGLAGLAIAQLMLWWLPGVGRRDPLGLAEHVPPWLSVLVPSELREPAPGPAAGRPVPSFDDGDDSVWLAPPAIQRQPAVLETPNTMAALVDEGAAPRVVDCPIATDCQALAGTPETTPDGILAADVDLAAAVMPARAPVYSGEELQVALSQAVAALDQLEAAAGTTREERAARARSMYERLCELAQVTTFAASDGPYFGQRMNAVDELLRRLASNESLLGLIGRTSAGWIAYPDRTSDGIVLVGDVIRVQPQGSLWETELRLLSRGETRVRLLSMLPPPLDPRMPYDTGQRLIVLGSMCAENPTGIESELPAVWRGLHHVIERSVPPPTLPHPAPRPSRPVRL